MRTLCVVAALVLAVTVVASRDYSSPAVLEHYTFAQYIHEFGKAYHTPAEYKLHKQVFQQNLARIIAHNRHGKSWRAAVNKFTDMTDEESSRYRGYNLGMAAALKAERPLAKLPHVHLKDLPESVDWRTVTPPIVTDVKDQGGCGSCWAFATTEQIECAVAQAGSGLLVLSPQNVVDCTPNPKQCGGSGGCNGATAELGMGYVRDWGISLDSVYPYTAQTGTCQNQTMPKAATIKSFVKLPENDYNALMVAIATQGPIAISVAAGAWNSYGGGVFQCDSTQVDIDHAVQLVGYGTDPDPSAGDYWIVRNSWGAGWGENGYIRIERHSDGNHDKWCEVDPTPSDGSGCQGGPAQVTVCGSCGIWYDSSYAVGGSLWPTHRHHQH
jgi:cathepsin L